MNDEITVEDFYARTAWRVGTLVRHPTDESKVGTIVKRGGRIWVNRDKLPMVRWDGLLDAEPVPWEQLERI